MALGVPTSRYRAKYFRCRPHIFPNYPRKQSWMAQGQRRSTVLKQKLLADLSDRGAISSTEDSEGCTVSSFRV